MFSGNIVNPIAQARLDSGYSLQRLAKRLDLSKQYISRAEHGTYRQVNPKLLAFAAENLNTSPERIVQVYRIFQKAVRNRTVLNVNPIQLQRGNSLLAGNEIFTMWRSSYWHSITLFSNAFCIHPELVRAYEDGNRDVMPNEIRTVLYQLGLINSNWSERAPAHGSPVRRSESLR